VQTIFTTDRLTFKPCKLAFYTFRVLDSSRPIEQTVRPLWISRRGEETPMTIIPQQREAFGGDKHGSLKLFSLDVAGTFKRYFLLDTTKEYKAPPHEQLIDAMTSYLADQPERLERMRQFGIDVSLRQDQLDGLR
jgi:hypothetical protein